MKIIDVPQSILDLLHQTGTNDAWPVPEPLMKPLRPVIRFDSKALLPAILREFCDDVAYRMQCPIDFVAVSVVCMLGAVIGAGCGVRPKQKDDWTEVPNLWGGVVGRPGRLKTPAISAGISPLRALEAAAENAYRSALDARMLQDVDRKLSIDLVKKRLGKIKTEGALKDSADMDRLRELNQPLEDAPRLSRYKTNDSTVEKLGECLMNNTRGMLVYRDELIGLLKGFEQQGHEGDRAFYLEGWNGRHSYRVDRIGRGEIFIPHLCLSVFGGIQPAKLQDYLFQVKQGGNDGLLQRFQLIVFPDDIEDPKTIDQEPNREAAEALISIVELLAGMDFGTVGATRDHPDEIPYFRFEPNKAQPVFFKWLAGLDQSVVTEDDPIIQEHFTKYRKLVPALALIFHLFKGPQKQSKTLTGIGVDSLRLAIAWADYLAHHARRIYSMALDMQVTAAEALARKLKVGALADGFSERDVYRNEWCNLTDTDLVRAACRELEAAGWIRRQEQPKGGRKGRPLSPTYDINPGIVKK